MTDKKCKIVLNTLIEHNFTYPRSDFYSITETLIPLLPKEKKYNWTLECLSPCLNYLIKHEYIEGIIFYHGYYPVADYKEVYVTYKGLNYKDFKKAEFISSLFKSVALPVIASLITTLIVSICGYIWGMRSIQIRNPNNPPTVPPTTIDTNCTNNS